MIWSRIRSWQLLLLTAFLLVRFQAFGLTACPITLAWNPSENPLTVGYALYYGPANSPSVTRMNVGSATSATLANLTAGMSYSFYVVAYDILGRESEPSNELTYNPNPLSKVQCVRTGSQLAVQFRSAPGSLCRIECRNSNEPNVNLQTNSKLPPIWSNPWLPLATVTADASGNISFVDPQAGQVPCRFYRAVRL